MTQPSAAQIRQLCDAWCNAVAVPGGGFAIGANTEQFRLLRNGVVFHDLDHESLCAALLGLTRALPTSPRLQ